MVIHAETHQTDGRCGKNRLCDPLGRRDGVSQRRRRIALGRSSSPDAGAISGVRKTAGAMFYGYARVSTDARDLTNQLVQLRAAGCDKVFREKTTGATADRPQLKKMMGILAPGDVVVITAVDRLSRDMTDLLVIARDMQRAGAGLRSLAEPVVDTTSDFAELVLAMLGVAAKLEHRRIKERTAAGRADAKAKGVKFGRKRKLTPHQQREALERVAAGEPTRNVARSYNVDQSTICRIRPQQVGHGQRGHRG
jgi:DNA invertase Pin-like site-specific DNA recombinase